MHPDFLNEEARERIRGRVPMTAKQSGRGLIGYWTKGGSYIVASSGSQTDSGQPRDLALILPGNLGQGAVVQLYVAAHPDLIAELRRAVE